MYGTVFLNLSQLAVTQTDMEKQQENKHETKY